MSRLLTAFGLCMAIVLAALPVFAAELYEDPATGQLYTKPAEGRTQVNLPTEKMGTIYEDAATGAVYTRPGENRKPVAAAPIATEPQAAAAGEAPVADYSSQAFSQAVKHVISDEEATTFPKVKVGSLFYGEYFYDFHKREQATDRNAFTLNRGYINVRADMTPEIKARVTPDITRTSDGWVLRLKFGYLDFHDFLKSYPSLEVKMGQFETAWLDYEEALWTYRMQGTMLIEREGYLTSADLGVSFKGKAPSDLGEWQVDVINGEGYKKAEANKYKSVQARLTLAPLQFSPYTKGLQLSGWCEVGRENQTTNMTRIIAFLGYKYEDDLFLGAEYDCTRGSATMGETGPAGQQNLKGSGYSVMGWYRMPFMKPLRVMGRYDRFNHSQDKPGFTVNRYIYGASYDLGKSVTFLVNNEHTMTGSGLRAAGKEFGEDLLKVDVQWKFN